ncbi:MAG: 16S rRNA (adenine(1518)-N(6)/adenine(1519)-N(6))-dimethyltransferase RsmA [Actinobacteria bacterium]|jgi:16S rRNA (adenine1518-N6/adenine1519-N6)-dimethyltransferase|nr:16S rRNA (adenine(1518)-N(6)/adenine(1519)-N(6))-dimethyltransferase RsmA [Actinomycetota bacterium]
MHAATSGNLEGRQAREAYSLSLLVPKRSLGQNFVIDPNTSRKIAWLGELHPGDKVLEIGPGLGALTGALVDAGAFVTAVEIDRRLVERLRPIEHSGRVRIVEGDILRISFDEILGQDRWKMVSNLPYNIATPTVMRILEDAPQVESMVVMVQREVARRWTARPGSSTYGAVTVRMSYFATSQLLGAVSRNVFVPRPRVESSLVQIKRLPEVAVDPTVAGYASMVELIHASYQHRRKMLRHSLAGWCSQEAFLHAGVSPESRPQELSIIEWGRLAAAIRSGDS